MLLSIYNQNGIVVSPIHRMYFIMGLSVVKQATISLLIINHILVIYIARYLKKNLKVNIPF